MFMNLEKKMKCGGRIISEYDEDLPKDLTVEYILINSSNIGSVKIGQIYWEKKNERIFGPNWNFKQDGIVILRKLGTPLPFTWNDCMLKTVSYGHGITTTPLQLAKGYAILSNGGYSSKSNLDQKKYDISKRKKILNSDVSAKINPILRKVVTNGTASLSDVEVTK